MDNTTSSFDIVTCYEALLSSNPNMTPPIAAIESLITLLATSSLTTISETLDLLSTHSKTLLSSQSNPIPVSAGTELFQRFLVSSFQQRHSSLINADFGTVKRHIITQSSLFVKRANEARLKIAQHALPFIGEDTTIITFGYSRVVSAIVSAAVESDRSFNVIFVEPAPSPFKTTSTKLTETISTLSNSNIQNTSIPLHALPLALSSLPAGSHPKILLGATAVLENGSIVTDIGTHAISVMAKTLDVPVYVCVESYKFTRNFPLGIGHADLERMGVHQNVLNFIFTSPNSEINGEDGDDVGGAGALERGGSDYFAAAAASTASKESTTRTNDQASLIEITPPNLIEALITENGIMTTNAVSEELIKLWF
jgi:translation initiation factor eIF-2B subunit alpha